ncbi:hypothetical protein GCM10025868_26260 [Angustibacter aerolatus]|uniref:Phosphoribosylformylglycinamidine synthase subunit PurL n=1 Tax=Angustibacter aerolatus TaxID=1162965 RepID=A0ABQ6JIJ7_9ACTN|nr:AIR synthase-related protein [Angustibacter aerolatus]GMA87376.1 hypothetical protein GCM10025868_26260 [Angustibacter aerolatus]
MQVWLDRVPLRDATLAPEEILMSESQERMMAVVTPEKLEAFLDITTRWDVEATVVGEVTGTGRLVVDWHGETVVDVPPRTVAHDGPVYERPYERPATLDVLQANTPDALQRPGSGDEPACDPAAGLLGSPNLSSRAWVTDQYDRYVMGNTALAMPDDAGVVRVDESTNLGVAISTDCNSRFAALDPYAGAQLALAEAYRNVATAGASPLAVTDCLNFGSPEDPGVMWQFAQAVTGLADACQQARRAGHRRQREPVQPDRFDGHPPDARRRRARRDRRRHPAHAVRLAAPGAGALPGRHHARRAGGSSWADVVHGHLGGLPPAVDLDAERVLAEILVAASRDGMVDAAHDLSDGGLAIALVEGCLRYGVGARVWLDEPVRARRHRPVRGAVQRVDRPRRRLRRAVGGGALHRHVQRPRRGPPAGRRGRRRRARRRAGARGAGPVHGAGGRAARRPRGHAAGGLRPLDPHAEMREGVHQRCAR